MFMHKTPFATEQNGVGKGGNGTPVRVAVVLIVAFLTLLTVACGGEGGDSSDYSNPSGGGKPTLEFVFGSLFGVTEEDFSGEQKSRAEENMEIPYENTLLSHAFDYVDMHHLYIRSKQHTLSETGYVTHLTEYAFSGKKLYIHLEVNGTPLYYVSSGKELWGLDFEDRTYTLVAPSSYTVEEIMNLDDFAFCSDTGKDVFLGEEKTYEDFTLNSHGTRSWIRYFFEEDGRLAGYVVYENGEMTELTCYEEFTSEFPEDAVLYFDIPAGFTLYDGTVEWSEIWWE